jgi:hypothetical protein
MLNRLWFRLLLAIPQRIVPIQFERYGKRIDKVARLFGLIVVGRMELVD